MNTINKPLDPITRLTERECIARIKQLQMMYSEAAEPYMKQIVAIRSLEHPKPFIGPDGKVYEYVGPWPEASNG